MLTAATLGMLVYGLYSAGWAVVDVFRTTSLEWWANTAQVLFGGLLMLSSAFVRVRIPGSLPLALGAMLSLQALAVHSSAHLGSGLAPQIGRAVLAVSLLAMAATAHPAQSENLEVRTTKDSEG
jgi:hypothetical protein